MQLIDYFRGRWLAWAIGVPAVVAAAVAVLVYATSVSEFEATAETSVLTAMPAGSTPFDIDILTEQVVVEFDSETVRAEVTDATGLTRPGVMANLDAVEVGNAGTLSLVLVAPERESAVEGLRRATRLALLQIARRELASLELAEEAARNAVADIRSDLEVVETTAGSGDVEEGARELGRRINQLELQATTAGSVAQQRAIEVLIEEAQEREVVLMASLTEWRGLRAQLAVADPDVTRAAIAAREGQAIVQRLEAEDPLTGVRVKSLPRLIGAIRSGITGGVLAGVLTVGAIIALQYFRRPEDRNEDDQSDITAKADAVEVKATDAVEVKTTEALDDTGEREQAAEPKEADEREEADTPGRGVDKGGRVVTKTRLVKRSRPEEDTSLDLTGAAKGARR